MCAIDVFDLQACVNACEVAGIHWLKFIFFWNCVRWCCNSSIIKLAIVIRDHVYYRWSWSLWRSIYRSSVDRKLTDISTDIVVETTFSKHDPPLVSMRWNFPTCRPETHSAGIMVGWHGNYINFIPDVYMYVGLFTTPEKNVTIFFSVPRNLYAQQFAQHFCHTKRCMILMAVHSLSQTISHLFLWIHQSTW